MEFGKVWNAAKLIILISLIFNLVMLGIGAGLGALGIGTGLVARGGGAGAVLGLAGSFLLWFADWGVRIVTFLGNFAIIAYGGYRAAKKENNMIGCGLVGLLTHAIVGFITGIISFVLSFFGVGASVLTSGNAITGAFAGILGAIGIGVGLICSVLWYLGGMINNFLISLVAGMIGGAK